MPIVARQRETLHILRKSRHPSCAHVHIEQTISLDEAEATVNMEVKTSPESTDPTPQAPTDASAGTPPAKPKRTRRGGEPKPKRYPVGEKDPEQGM
ncbi:hypothetical protein [Dictyobacter formicarum]|uniref:hypothetical protein n=1 Tax=Dictyobacter formicarum TaxID=2778368 RepID=UPI001916442A|nr:hypothetical protein [Dictyobacter formicarum]